MGIDEHHLPDLTDQRKTDIVLVKLPWLDLAGRPLPAAAGELSFGRLTPSRRAWRPQLPAASASCAGADLNVVAARSGLEAAAAWLQRISCLLQTEWCWNVAFWWRCTMKTTQNPSYPSVGRPWRCFHSVAAWRKGATSCAAPFRHRCF
jgi:hypothetical protein